jgi:hypothetical protein
MSSVYEPLAGTYDESSYFRAFQQGDTVRRRDDPYNYKVIGTRGDWVWLESFDCRDPAPFTARARDCDLMKAADWTPPFACG